MHPCRDPSPTGFTLLELAFAVGLIVSLLAVSAPRLARAGDAWAAAGVRDAVMALAHRARLLARERGSAELLFADGVGIEVRSGSEVVERLVLPPGVTIDHGGGDSLRIGWDALGVGRVASRTVRVRRGRAELRLVFASTGRVRRR